MGVMMEERDCVADTGHTFVLENKRPKGGLLSKLKQRVIVPVVIKC
jgi:hypothetical protein